MLQGLTGNQQREDYINSLALRFYQASVKKIWNNIFRSWNQAFKSFWQEIKLKIVTRVVRSSSEKDQ